MKKFFCIKSILIVASIIIIAMNLLSRNSYAAGVYTAKLSKGDCLKFIGDSWIIYPTKDKAIALKKDSKISYLKKGDKITIMEVYGNVLKIKDNGYIYYGSTAANYFEKIEKKTEEKNKKEQKNKEDEKNKKEQKNKEDEKNKEIPKLTEIIVTNKPNKTIYNKGDKFSNKGMIVLAKYSDKSKKEIKNYTILDGEKLKESQKNIQIIYIENGITKTTSVEIKVNKKEEIADFNSKIIKMAKALAEQKVEKGASPIKVTIDSKKLKYQINRGMDCTGAVQVCAKYAGAKYNINTVTNIKNDKTYTKVIDKSKVKAGDLIIYNGHVGISDGKGGVYHTSSSAKKFAHASNANFMSIVEYRRIIK